MTENLPALILADMDLSRALQHSNLLNRDYHKQPSNVLLVVGLGRAVGIEPAVALTQINVIDGKPQMSAALQAGLVQRAGHRLRVTENPDGSATATLIRADDPEFEHRAHWTLDKAKAAGLLGKQGGAWSKYPMQMLKNRAVTEVIRLAAADVFMGAVYDPDEIDPAHDQHVQIERAEPEHPRLLETFEQPAYNPETGEVYGG